MQISVKISDNHKIAHFHFTELKICYMYSHLH